jgi:hypothetical protein
MQNAYKFLEKSKKKKKDKNKQPHFRSITRVQHGKIDNKYNQSRLKLLGDWWELLEGVKYHQSKSISSLQWVLSRRFYNKDSEYVWDGSSKLWPNWAPLSSHAIAGWFMNYKKVQFD